MLAEALEVTVTAEVRVRKIAWAPTSVDVPADQDALQAIELAVQALSTAGFDIQRIDLPPTFGDIHKAVHTIMEKECVASFQAELAQGEVGIVEGNVKMVQNGKAISWSVYEEARKAIEGAGTAFYTMLEGYDAFLTLSTPGQAPVAECADGADVYAGVWTVRICDGLPLGKR